MLSMGIGRGLSYAPGLIIVGMYFNRRRGLGVGLSTAGRLRSVFFNAFVFLLCALLFVVPSLSSFPEFVAVFGMFGMLTGAYVCQKSVILVDMLGCSIKKARP
nr:hypothetical protein BaRGS_030676 [Batillaria attramentaria]